MLSATYRTFSFLDDSGLKGSPLDLLIKEILTHLRKNPCCTKMHEFMLRRSLFIYERRYA